MFDSLLIANRGEIACRIMKTARRMGLRTIAVHSDADRDALHVAMADETVPIGAAPARDSYLRVDRIVEAARQTGAAAIHPGYGFLSERPELAEACLAAGLIWVGPHPRAIRAMGSKTEARVAAERAGLACIPGHAGPDQSDDDLRREALAIGLPVMIKASAGGGGKGMRAVHDAAELLPAIAAARAEAERAFGDGSLLVEQLIRNPRHIEVQLLGDRHGTLLHLFERDCSVQRHHQKLLEEAPAPNLSAETRQRLCDAALRLGRAIAYDSAGTVEFVIDAATEAFFFLEMNTRLQVEHTVTEAVTGLDLVEQQLRVAAGEPLSLSQTDIACNGHAIEARLTAEDAADGFRPDTGEILHWAPDPGLRCDAGVRAGSIVGPHYDSLIAKLVAHGTDREAARRRLVRGFERTEIVGLSSNRLFLRDALARERFVAGRATTDFVRDEWPDGWKAPPSRARLYAVLAGHLRRETDPSPWGSLGGFRLLSEAGRPARSVYVDADAPQAPITIEGQKTDFRIIDKDGVNEVTAVWTEPGRLEVTAEGHTEAVGVYTAGERIFVSGRNFDDAFTIRLLADCNPEQTADRVSTPDRIAAPMPGVVAEIRTALGAQVCEGEALVVMESMKLLIELRAAATGRVVDIGVAVGQTVEAGRLLIELDTG